MCAYRGNTGIHMHAQSLPIESTHQGFKHMMSGVVESSSNTLTSTNTHFYRDPALHPENL